MNKKKFMHASVCAALLIALSMSPGIVAQDEAKEELKVGDKAPNFDLVGSDGKQYTLSQFKGKKPVVLAFFPKAFTGGRTAQCKSLRDSGQQLKDFDIAYFMVSHDKPEDNKKFAETHSAGFPILSDPDKTLAEPYGALHERGFYNRWTFYIDKEGTIVKIDKAVKAARAGEDTIANLKELGLVD